MNLTKKWHIGLLIILIILGIYFRYIEYSSNKSFWFDEAKTAIKIAKTPLSHITNGALASKRQPYPPGFLAFIKILASYFGNTEQVLRFFPLFCGIVSLPLFYMLACQILAPPMALLALSLFSLSPNLIYYSAELKPYTSDVLFVIIVYYIFVHLHTQAVSKYKIMFFSILGGGILWFSYPSLFVMAGGGTALMLHYLFVKDYKRFKQILIVGVFWMMHFLLFYLLYVRFFVSDKGLVNYWKVAYMPRNVLSSTFFQWFLGSMSLFFKINLKFPVSLSAFMVVLGGAGMFLKQRVYFYILFSPFLVTLLASYLRMYPFQGRVIMFLVPSFILIITYGIHRFVSCEKRFKSKSWFIVLIIFFLFYPILHTLRQAREPFGRSEIKPVMFYLARHIQEKDPIYLYYSSRFAFEYYSQRYGLNLSNCLLGIDSRHDVNKYVTDLQQLRGLKRVWIVFSDVFYEREGINEREFFLNTLNSFGKQLDAFEVYLPPYTPPTYLEERFSAGVYLYDLSI